MVGRDMASYYPPQLQLLKLRYLAAERYPALGPLSDAAEVERYPCLFYSCRATLTTPLLQRHKQYEYWSERGKAKPQPRRTNKKRKR